jgi:photosystem II stability/assembly factor-like uncharacterized protein
MVHVASDGTVNAFVVESGLITSPAAALEWSTVNADFGQRVLLHMAVDRSDRDRMFAVADDGRILASSDGGKGWQPLAAAAESSP